MLRARRPAVLDDDAEGPAHRDAGILHHLVDTGKATRRADRCQPAAYGDFKGKLIAIGATLIGHGHFVAFQMAEIAIPRTVFAEILRQKAERRPRPPAAALDGPVVMRSGKNRERRVS